MFLFMFMYVCQSVQMDPSPDQLQNEYLAFDWKVFLWFIVLAKSFVSGCVCLHESGHILLLLFMERFIKICPYLKNIFPSALQVRNAMNSQGGAALSLFAGFIIDYA